MWRGGNITDTDMDNSCGSHLTKPMGPICRAAGSIAGDLALCRAIVVVQGTQNGYHFTIGLDVPSESESPHATT